ncbi:MAG: hypothetical protein DMD40_03695 [Gemmatimonadetes bacterium]|nr:MAG: hypothetical protein DMD40_03695 [Gemmatimonadota bacterium]
MSPASHVAIVLDPVPERRLRTQTWNFPAPYHYAVGRLTIDMDAVGRRYRIDAVIANEKERATSSFSGSAAIGQLADDGTSCSPITRSSREEINPTQPL